MKRKTRLISILTLLCVLIISLVSCLCLLTACSDSEPEGEAVKKGDGTLAGLAAMDHSYYTSMKTMMSLYGDGTTLTLTSKTDKYIYLDGDYTCNIVMEKGSSALICLHGHTLTGVGGDSVITLKEGANGLILMDCDDEAQGKIKGGSGHSVTASDGYTYKEGGAIYVSSGAELEMFGCTITGNSANLGGAIFLDDDASLYLGTNYDNRCVITDNTASYSSSTGGGPNGGGIFAKNATIEIHDVEISNNQAVSSSSKVSQYGGGGIFAYNSDVKMYGGTISGNYTDGGYTGAGICLEGSSTLTMTDGEIKDNVALGGAGIVAHPGTTLDISGGKITGNDASSYFMGGGLYIGGKAKLSNVEISGNTAVYGGGIYVGDDADVTIGEGTVISGNEAVDNSGYGLTAQGGGLYAASGSITIAGGEISDNTAVNGGGLYAASTSSSSKPTVTLSGGKIDNNTSSGDGGGVYLKGTATFTMNSGSVSYNESTKGNGGGLYLADDSSYSPVATINGGDISHNKAYKYGGGVCLNSSAAFTLAGGHIDYNETTSNYRNISQGGGVYMMAETSFVMSSGSVSYNKSTCQTGGVHVGSNASFTMTGGEIVGNMAFIYGGVFVSSSATFTVSGKVAIDGNCDCELNYGKDSSCFPSKPDDLTSTTCYSPSDVNIFANGAITLGGTLSSGSSVGIAYDQQGGASEQYVYTQITAAESSTKYYQSSYEYFFLDYEELAEKYTFYADTSKKCVTIVDFSTFKVYAEDADGQKYGYSTLADAFSDAEDGYTIYLNSNVSLSSAISVYSDVTLDLQGNSISLSSGIRAFYVRSGATFTLCDSTESYGTSTAKSGGTAKNGNAYTTTYLDYDGKDDETFQTSYTSSYKTYTAGAITGMSSTSMFGCIYVYAGGTFDMCGGILCNLTGKYGSGVFLQVSSTSKVATFNMYGGSISGNTASTNGAAVYLAYNAVCNIYGGILANNSSDGDGAAIYLEANASYRCKLTIGAKDYGTLKHEVKLTPVITESHTSVGNGASVYAGYGVMYMYDGDITNGLTSKGNCGGVFIPGDGGSSYGTLYFSGGRVMYNTSYNTWYDGTSVYGGSGVSAQGYVHISGDAYCYNNVWNLAEDNSLYYNAQANIYVVDNPLEIDPAFSGYIGIMPNTIVTNYADVQVSTVPSSGSYTYEWLQEHIYAEKYGAHGGCIGIASDGSLWGYDGGHDTKHTECYKIELYSNGTKTSYALCAYCLQCGTQVSRSWCDFEYRDGDGVYATKSNSYGYYELKIEEGFVVKSGTTYTWYADLDSALEAMSSGDTLYVCEDVSGGIEVTTSGVTVNLNGHDVGSITVSNGASVSIEGDGDVGELSVSSGSATLSGGTYGNDIRSIGSVSVAEGYAIYVNGDGTYSVVDENTAKSSAAASVTVDGKTYYFETFEEAVEYASENANATEGVKITLYEDVSNANIDWSLGNLEIDLNGHELDGEISVSGGASVTISGSGDVDATITVDGSSSLNVSADSTGSGIEITLESGSSLDGTTEIESGNVTIDLGGNTIEGELKVDGGATLTVTGSGEVDAAVTVASESESGLSDGGKLIISANESGSGIDVTLESGSSVSDMEITSGDVSVDLGGNTIGSLTVGDGDSSTTSNVTITDSSENNSGTITDIKTSDSGSSDTLSVEGGSYTEEQISEIFENLGDDYAIVYTPADDEGDGSYSVVSKEDSSITNAAASVTVTDSDGNTSTVYFDDISNAVDYAQEHSETGTAVTITLESDVEDMTITDGNIEVDLNGNTVGSLTVGDKEDSSSTASVTVVDSSDGGDGTIKSVTVNNDETGGNDGNELSIQGGSYAADQLDDLFDYLGEYVFYLDEDGELYIVTDEDSAKENSGASVTFTDENGNSYSVYFEDTEAAVEYAEDKAAGESDEDSSVKITLYEDAESITITNGDITLDLNGNSVGSLTIGDTGEGSENTTASVTVVDTSDEKTGSVGELNVESDDTLSIEGGTFSQDISSYIDEDKTDLTTILGLDETGENYTYHIVESEDEAKEFAAASVIIDEQTYYFDSIEAAIKYIESDDSITSATITLLEDTVMSLEAEISSSSITIDLNGHNLTADITIEADNGGTAGAGGSLKVTDMSEEKSGSIAGTISVTGTSTDTSEGETNTYESTLIFSDVVPDKSLITVDLTNLKSSGGEENFEYSFSLIETNDNTVSYGITIGHEHAYTIPVWEKQDDGTYVLKFECTCGDFETVCSSCAESETCECECGECTCSDGECSCDSSCKCREDVTYEVTLTYGEPDSVTGEVTITMTVIFGEEDEHYSYYTDGTITNEITISPKASITVEEDTFYFETVEDALAYAATLEDENVTIVLMDDCDSLVVADGSITIDLNGFEIGTLVVGDTEEVEGYDSTKAAVIVVDSSDDNSGTIGVITVNDNDSSEDNTLVIAGGMYTEDQIDDISGYLGDGSAIYSDGESYQVVDASKINAEGTDVAINAEAKLTYTITVEEGTEQEITIYFENLEEAIDYATGLVDETSGEGPDVTITLLDDVEADIEITTDNITIDLDGNKLSGDISIANDAELTVTGSGEIDAVFDVAGETEEGGETKEAGKLIIEADNADDNEETKNGITIKIEDGSSFEGEIEVASGDVTVDLAGNELGTLVVGDEDNEEASASVTVTDSSEGNSGTIDNIEVKDADESGNDSLSIQGGTFGEDALDYIDKDGGYVAVSDGEGNYVIVSEEEVGSVAAVAVTIDEETYYFSSLQDAIDYIEKNSSITDEVTIKLLQDVEEDVAISSAGVTIDLDGHSLIGDVTVSGGSLTIEDNNDEEKTGSVTGHIEGSSDDITIKGGTYTEDVSQYLGDDLYLLVDMTSDGNSTYTVVSSVDEAVVKITDADGNDRYYSSADVAFSDAKGGETVTLLGDISSEEYSDGITLSGDGSITLDLNGNTISCDITVGEGSDSVVLTVTDSSTNEDKTGSISGIISTNSYSSAILEGGVYGSDPRESEGYVTVGSGYEVVKLGDESGYAVMKTEDAVNASAAFVTVETLVATDMEDENGDPIYETVTETLYFESLSDAIAYAEKAAADDDAASVTVTLLQDVSETDGIAIESGDVTLDLNGHSVSSLTVGDENNSDGAYAHVTVVDSVGSGTISSIEVNNSDESGDDENTLSIQGGTYKVDEDGTLDYVAQYIDEGYVLVNEGNGQYVVTDLESVEYVAAASVTGEDDETIYFENIVDALEYAATNGGTVTLYDDAVISYDEESEISITGDVTIDLNGHTLDANIEVDAASGSLTITDSVGGGSIEGTISVKDSTEPTTEGSDYSTALSFEDGVAPNGDLEIDLSGLGTDDGESSLYVFEEKEDGTYAISDAASHSHSYTIEVWTRDGEKVTLKLMCACGDYLKDKEGNEVEYVADNVTYTDNGDGTVTVTATVAIKDEEGNETTYSYSETFKPVASVAATVDGKRTTIYFDDFESALEYAAANGGYVTLLDDVTSESGVTIESGNVSLDLNGHTVTGNITVGDSDPDTDATLTILDSSVNQSGAVLGNLAVTDSGNNRLILNDGSYTENILESGDIETSKDRYVVVGSETDDNGEEMPIYTVTDSETAESRSAASVTVTDADGSETTVYFESIEDAIEYAEKAAKDSLNESVKVTLYDDVEKMTFESGDIELDLNGHSVGELAIGDSEESNSASVTITDSSEDQSGYVGNLTIAESGNNSATVEGGTFGCDILDTDGVDIGEGLYILVGEADENGDHTYTVTDEKTAQESAAASVTVTDADGNETTVYFEDADDAIAYAEEAAAAASEDDVKVTLYEDVEDLTFSSGDIELDLNGYSVGEITVGTTGGDEEEGTSANVTITDSSEDQSGYVGNITINQPSEEPEEGESSVTIEGGTFGCDILDMDGVETGEDSYILVGEDEDGNSTYAVTDEKTAQESAAASVTVTDADGNKTTVYFEDADDAVAYAEEAATAAEEGEEVKVTLYEDADEIDFTSGDIELDLNGHSVETLVIGDDDSTTSASVTITDSSSDNSGYVGTIVDEETADDGEGEKKANSVTIEGGTFGEDVSEYLDENSYGVIYGTDENGDATYKIAGIDDLESLSEVSVTFTNDEGKEETRYFESIEDAIEFAATNDGTITLLDDVEADIRLGVDYAGNLTIDLNGHTLTADIEINAGSESTLTVTDSSSDGSGRIEGTIAVSDYSEDKSDDYSDALVFEGGVAPNGNLDIDLSGLGTDGDSYVFSEVTDSEGNIAYGIVDASKHTHSYTIEVWTRENGVVTLKLMCSCGEYLADENGEVAVFEVAATYTVDETTGAVTISATYTDSNGTEHKYEETIVAVASVTVTDASGNETVIYFDDLQDAVNYAQSAGETVTLLTDVDEDIVTTENVTIDLNGHALAGSLDVESGTTTIVDNSQGGTITMDCNVTVESGAELVIGSEDGTTELDISGSINIEEGGKATVNGSGEIGAELIVSGELDITSTSGVDIYGDITLDDGTIEVSGSVATHGDIVAAEGTTNSIGGESAVLDIEGPIYVEEDALLTIAGSGEISSSLSVEDGGTLEVKGIGEDGMTLSLEDDTTLEGTLALDGDVTLELNGNDLDAAIEIADNSEITLDGQGGTITLEENLETSGTTITVTSDTCIDVAGHELAARSETVGEGEEATEVGGITVESGTLTIEDSTFGGSLIGDVTVESGAGIEIGDDVIGSYERVTEADEEEEGEEGKEKGAQTGFTVTFEDEDYVLSSAMDSFGNIRYETVTVAEHKLSGCNYDFAEIEDFDAETCTLTIKFTCLCGETWTEQFQIYADDYTAYAGADDEGKEAVVVDIDAFITVSNPVSGVTYTHEIVFTDYLPMYTEGAGDEEGYDDPNYSYKYNPADCTNTGFHVYTYKGTGVTVTVVIPRTHTYVRAVTTSSGETYYVCDKSEGGCGKVFYSKDGNYNIDESGALLETDDLLIYENAEDLTKDIENNQSYEESRESAMSEAEGRMSDILDGMDSDSEYAKKIEEIYEQLLEDLGSMGYDWQNGDEDYMSDALAEIEDILDEALFEMDVASTQYDLSEEIEDIYRGYVESGLYDDAALTEFEELYSEIMDGVGNLNLSRADAERSGYESYDEYLEDVYARFIARVVEMLNKIRLYSMDADESAEGAVSGAISSESGFEGDATFSIFEIDTFDIEEILSGFTFVDMTTGAVLSGEDGEPLTEEEIAALFDGKEILAGYSISISSGDAEISVYNGVYTIRILLPEEFAGMTNFTIVYVGNDGTIEVYEATVDGGYIVFETTHFSDYYLIGDEIIAESGYGVATIILGIVLIIELVIAAVFLIWYFVKRSSTTRAKVLWTLLYAAIAAAGIAFIVAVMALYSSLAAVITYAVLCGVMLAADILLGYLVTDAAGSAENDFVRPQDAFE